MSNRDDLLLAVRHLYGAIERFDAAAAAALDVDRTGLRAINAMERGAISPGRLGTELGLSSGSVTALLDRLERAGHIQRTLSPDDGRRRDAHLTAEARRAADQIYGRLGVSIHQTFASTNDGSLAELVSGLNALAEAFVQAGSKSSGTDLNSTI
jgi:DNA-binding MarR family transcriptional regulator